MTRKKRGDSTKELFIDPDGQLKVFDKSLEQELDEERHKEVECLGRTFPNDEERRKYFLDKLHEKLKDPEFRKIEGFPIGTGGHPGPVRPALLYSLPQSIPR